MSKHPPLCYATKPPKKRYRDEIAAKIALASIKAKDSSRRSRTEQEAYRCGVCQGFHLRGPRRRRKEV